MPHHGCGSVVAAHIEQARVRLARLLLPGRRWAALEAIAEQHSWPDRMVIALERALFDGVERAAYAERSGGLVGDCQLRPKAARSMPVSRPARPNRKAPATSPPTLCVRTWTTLRRTHGDARTVRLAVFLCSRRTESSRKSRLDFGLEYEGRRSEFRRSEHARTTREKMLRGSDNHPKAFRNSRSNSCSLRVPNWANLTALESTSAHLKPSKTRARTARSAVPSNRSCR